MLLQNRISSFKLALRLISFVTSVVSFGFSAFISVISGKRFSAHANPILKLFR